jgi:hypothetical protein
MGCELFGGQECQLRSREAAACDSLGCKSRTLNRLSWPKAILIVAWGITPGLVIRRRLLAEGHTHRSGNAASLNMAFGQ